MSINLDVLGNTSPLEAQVQAAINRIRKTPKKIRLTDFIEKNESFKEL